MSTFYVATRCDDTDRQAVLSVTPIVRQEYRANVTCSACEQTWTGHTAVLRTLPSVSAVEYMAATSA